MPAVGPSADATPPISDRDEELEREVRPVVARVGDAGELHGERAGEPADRGGGDERAEPAPRGRRRRAPRPPAGRCARGAKLDARRGRARATRRRARQRRAARARARSAPSTESADGTTSPCAPPETEGNASRKIATGHVRIHVVTAMNTGRRRTTPAPVTTPPPRPPRRTTTTSREARGQPAFAVSSATVNAPIAMNAPCPSDGIPPRPTASQSPVAASAR